MAQKRNAASAAPQDSANIVQNNDISKESGRNGQRRYCKDIVDSSHCLHRVKVRYQLPKGLSSVAV